MPQASRRLCSHPVVMAASSSADLARWTRRRLLYFFQTDSHFGHLAIDAAKRCFVWAWFQWMQHCTISAFETLDRDAADIVIWTGDIDGPWNAVALSEFPDGSDHQLQMKFDQSEHWSDRMDCAVTQLPLQLTALHEIGHVLGIPHLTAHCIMSADYDRSVSNLMAEDIEEARKRYG